MSNEFPAQAVDTLTREVHDPCFFHKLASDWNIRPRNDEERTQLLELAAMLRGVNEVGVKTASVRGNSFLASAIDSLKGALNDRGYGNMLTSDQQAIKEAAAIASTHPAIAGAALQYAEHLFAAEQ